MQYCGNKRRKVYQSKTKCTFHQVYSSTKRRWHEEALWISSDCNYCLYLKIGWCKNPIKSLCSIILQPFNVKWKIHLNNLWKGRCYTKGSIRKDVTFQELCEKYANFIWSTFSQFAVVFDSYGAGTSTEDHVHCLRSVKREVRLSLHLMKHQK